MNRSFIKTIVLLLFLYSFLAASQTLAATLVVTKTDDTNDGVCDGDCSLCEAVAAAASDDTVVFSSLFNSPQTLTLTGGQIAIDKNLTINGTGSDLVIISGNLAGRVFFISGNLNVTISGMKLRDGKVGTTVGDSRGGAIFVANGNGALALSNTEFTNNTAFINDQFPFGKGKAAFCYGCTMTLTNVNAHHNGEYGCAIQADNAIINIRDSELNNNRCGASGDTLNVQNTIVQGNAIGGIGAEQLLLIGSRIINNLGIGVTGSGGSTMTIDTSVISGNRDSGIWNSGIATIRNSMIKDNTTSVSGLGGGIYNGGTIFIINSSITGNLASQGGGIWTGIGQLFVTNSTISGNAASGIVSTSLGGGIYNATTGSPGSQVTLTNSTIVNNQSSGKGGGIRQDATGSLTIRNTVIAQNTSTSTNELDVSGQIISDGVNLVGNTTGSTGWIAADLLNVNPLLGPLADNGGPTMTHALLRGSPAINTGSNDLAVDPYTGLILTTDQRGFFRFIGNSVDIGAYESHSTQAPVTISGRALSGTGRGIPNVRLTLTDKSGAVIYAGTNPFGYYRFIGLPVGTTYTLTVTHKYYRFVSPQIITATESHDDLNFVASP